MIDVPTSVKALVIASAIVALATGVINGAALRKHLRRHHSAVLRKLGYPAEMAALVKPKTSPKLPALTGRCGDSCRVVSSEILAILD